MMVGRAQPISPGIRIQSLVDWFGLGAYVCAAVAFLVMRLIQIGWIDGIRPGIPCSGQGPSPSPDWDGLGPESV